MAPTSCRRCKRSWGQACNLPATTGRTRSRPAAAIEHRKRLLRRGANTDRPEAYGRLHGAESVGSMTWLPVPVATCTMTAGPLDGTGSQRTAAAIT